MLLLNLLILLIAACFDFFNDTTHQDSQQYQATQADYRKQDPELPGSHSFELTRCACTGTKYHLFARVVEGGHVAPEECIAQDVKPTHVRDVGHCHQALGEVVPIPTDEVLVRLEGEVLALKGEC